jgi:hypothetical protein
MKCRECRARQRPTFPQGVSEASEGIWLMAKARPRQAFAGVVGAGEDQVWGALLETSSFVSPRMRAMIAGSHGPLRFPAGPADGGTSGTGGGGDGTGGGESSPVPGVNVEADPDQHMLAVSGQWWFRGVYRTSPQGPDTLLRYEVFNVAPGATRWLVPLVAGPALRASARPQFEQTLAAIGATLGCPVRLAG